MESKCPVCRHDLDGNESICPWCGFRLTDATQEFEPLSLDSNRLGENSKPQQETAYLQVIRGPQVGVVFLLDGDSFIVGRNPKCDIFLNDMTVSRDHAKISRMNSVFVIEDRNSFNGVWINNKSIESATLKKDDVIQIGTFCLLYGESDDV